MAMTWYVALPFVRTEEGAAPGEAQEMPNEGAAIRRAESMSRDPANAGALAFKRSAHRDFGRGYTWIGRLGFAPFKRPTMSGTSGSSAQQITSRSVPAIVSPPILTGRHA
jgi:hypothetical protein